MAGFILSNISLSKIILDQQLAGPEFKVYQDDKIDNTGKAFGYSLSSDNESLIVGAYSSAKAVIYNYNGITGKWQEAVSYTKTGRFGYKVAISGDWAAVATSPTSGNGQVFIYRRIGGVWQPSEFMVLSAPVDVTGSGFGYSVSLHNNTLVVGQRQGNQVGGVLVYVWNGTTWVRQGSFLTVTSAQTRVGTTQNIGVDVSVHGDILVAGGSGDILGKGKGIALVSKRTGSTWSTPVIISPPTTYSDGYGWSVKVKGTTIVVGAPAGSSTVGNPGRAFVYDFSGVSPVLVSTFTVQNNQSEIIQDNTMAFTDSYGWAVEINEAQSVIAVGSINRDSNKGIVYVYEKYNGFWNKSALTNSWVLPTIPTTNARFGSSISINDDGMTVGSYGLGSIYWFK